MCDFITIPLAAANNRILEMGDKESKILVATILTFIFFSTGRSEPGIVPSIVGFTKDSVAQESDRLAPGDRICSVNGISTARLTNDEVLRLLDNVEERASLEVEYYMPNYGKSVIKFSLMSRSPHSVNLTMSSYWFSKRAL